VAVGENNDGQRNVSGWNSIEHISAGKYHTAGLKSDGTVVAVGDTYYGQCDVGIWDLKPTDVGICGDVNDDGNINMADVMTLLYDVADYPEPGTWTISNEWAADVNCDGQLNMADVMRLWYDLADYPLPGEWQVDCCNIL
jgi:hypothetical protein